MPPVAPVALVTGANQGLGLALVRGLARTLGEDAAVYLTARDPERGRAAVQQLESEGLHPRLLALDVTDAASVAAAAQAVHAAHGGVDVVIQAATARNAAGLALSPPPRSTPSSTQWNR